MKIIIRREPDFQNRHYCILEFSGKFEGDEEETRANKYLGSLHKVDPTSSTNTNYIIEMGPMDIPGSSITNIDEQFLHV
jgi:hypothetical protein